MANKKLLSALLSISFAATSLSFTGCGEYEEKVHYLLEFEDDNLIIYEIKDYPLRDGLSYDFVTLDGKVHTTDISNCIVLETHEEAEEIYNIYTNQEDKNAIWIGDIKGSTMGVKK